MSNNNTSAPAIAQVHSTIANYLDGQQSTSTKERSTVGSASATSVGGRTTWASGSDGMELDKMSEGVPSSTNSNSGNNSVDNFSDDVDFDDGNDPDPSLVDFDEGAGSTVSGPTTSHTGSGLSRIPSGHGSLGSPALLNRGSGSGGGVGAGAIPAHLLRHASSGSDIPPSPADSGVSSPEGQTAASQDVRMIDGMTYDPGVVDTTTRVGQLVSNERRSP